MRAQCLHRPRDRTLLPEGPTHQLQEPTPIPLQGRVSALMQQTRKANAVCMSLTEWEQLLLPDVLYRQGHARQPR